MRFAIKLFCIIAIEALIGFAMAGCSSPAGSDNGGGGGNASGNGPHDSSTTIGSGGSPLVLKGQVYSKDDSGDVPVYSKYQTGGQQYITDFYDDIHGSGTISSTGQLNYTISAPESSDSHWIDFTVANMNLNFEFADFADYYTDLVINASGIRAYILTTLCAGYNGDSFINESESISISGNSFSDTQEQLVYLYVTGDVTFSGTGGNINATALLGYPAASTSANFSLALKQGWNALYIKNTGSGTASEITGTQAITLVNSAPPALWVGERILSVTKR